MFLDEVQVNEAQQGELSQRRGSGPGSATSELEKHTYPSTPPVSPLYNERNDRPASQGSHDQRGCVHSAVPERLSVTSCSATRRFASSLWQIVTSVKNF